MSGLTRQQLLGRQGVPNGILRQEIEIDPLASLKPRFSADHHAPVSSVRVHVQRHFGDEGVQFVDQDAHKYDDAAIQAEREAKQAQLAQMQAKVQRRAHKTAVLLKQQQMAAAASQEQAVRERAQRVQQYNQQVAQRNLKGKSHCVATKGQQPLSPDRGDIQRSARDQDCDKPTGAMSPPEQHPGNITAFAQAGVFDSSEPWPFQAGALEQQQQQQDMDDSELCEEPSAACWAQRQRGACRRSVDRASWKDADTSSESSDEVLSTHSTHGTADGHVLRLTTPEVQGQIGLQLDNACTLQPAQLAVTPNPRHGQTSSSSPDRQDTSIDPTVQEVLMASQEPVHALLLPARPIDGDTARAHMLKHAMGMSGWQQPLHPIAQHRGYGTLGEEQQGRSDQGSDTAANHSSPCQPAAAAGFEGSPQAEVSSEGQHGASNGCHSSIQDGDLPRVVRIFSKKTASDCDAGGVGQTASTASTSTTQPQNRVGVASRRRAPHGTVYLEDPLSLIRARQQAAHMQITLPALCSCPSGCSMFDAAYTSKCARNCPLFHRPDLHEALLNQMLHTHGVLSN